MTMRKMYLAFPLVCAATAQGLTGCGDASSKVRDQLVPTTISGFAIDGKLENADCCLDVNRNRNCDSTELTSFTSSLGEFEFVTLDPNVGLVCEAIPGSTRDTATNQIVTREYTLVAPPRAKTVNPLTTLAQVAVEQGLASSFEAAAELVLEKIGLKDTTIGGAKIDVTNFDYDALTSSSDAATAAVARKVLVVATVVSETIATNINTVKVAAGQSGAVDALATTRNTVDLAVLNLLETPTSGTGTESILEQITKSAETVLQSEGENFDLANLNDVITKTTAEADKVVTLITVDKVLETITAVNTNNEANNPPIVDTPIDPIDATGATGGTGATGATGSSGVAG